MAGLQLNFFSAPSRKRPEIYFEPSRIIPEPSRFFFSLVSLQLAVFMISTLIMMFCCSCASALQIDQGSKLTIIYQVVKSNQPVRFLTSMFHYFLLTLLMHMQSSSTLSCFHRLSFPFNEGYIIRDDKKQILFQTCVVLDITFVFSYYGNSQR